jgi:hypothetical protein
MGNVRVCEIYENLASNVLKYIIIKIVNKPQCNSLKVFNLE